MERDLQLLRSLVAGDAAAAHGVLGDPSIDLPAFFGFVRRHQLGSFAYLRLQEFGLASRLPRPILAAAKATALLERDLGERLVAQMASLGEMFEAAGIPVIFIKGPLLATRYYGSVDGRSSCDLDVLIRTAADLARTDSLLLENGFERDFRVLLSRRLSRYFAHHFEYRQGSLPLDVHWALQRHFTFDIDYARVWSTAARVEFGGRCYAATSDEYEIVLQVLGVLTDLQVGKLTLRPLVDLVHMLARVDEYFDWTAFLEARRREHTLRPTAFVLALALDVIGHRSDFPQLVAELAPVLATLPSTSRAHRGLLEGQPSDIGQKLLALRIYEAPLAASLAWWALSLPFRLAVYGVAGRRARA
jgi:hypothetical protein